MVAPHGVALRLDAPADAWINTHVLTAEDFRGLPTLLHFFSNECQPCEEQLFQVHQWLSLLHGRGLQLVGVYVPLEDGTESAARALVRRFDLRHPVIADGGRLARLYQVPLLPAYLVFDAHARLTLAASGKDCVERVDRALERVVREYEAMHPSSAPVGAPFT